MRKNQLIETDPQLPQMLNLAHKDLKTIVLTALHIFRKLSRDIKYIK